MEEQIASLSNYEQCLLESKIIKQVEFYFSDINLYRDKYLRQLMKIEDGWIPLKIIATFQRMSKLSSNIFVISDALKKATSGFLEMSDDYTKVRRNPMHVLPKYNKHKREEIKARTVFIKGFPLDTTFDDIVMYLQLFEQIDIIVMMKYKDRRSNNQYFKGSVQVTFKSKQQAENFLASNNNKYKDYTLYISSKEDYLEQRALELKAKRRMRMHAHFGNNYLFEHHITLPACSVLRFVNDNEYFSRKDITEALRPLNPEIVGIHFSNNGRVDNNGWIRLSEPYAAKKILDKINNGRLLIKNSIVQFSILQSQDEEAFIKKIVQDKIAQSTNRLYHNL